MVIQLMRREVPYVLLASMNGGKEHTGTEEWRSTVITMINNREMLLHKQQLMGFWYSEAERCELICGKN